MDTAHSPTVVRAFTAVTTSDATRPLITFYDDATGERAELSGATLRNWVAKTANLLVDGIGLGPDQRAAVALPPHWLTAAILLGCWSAGLAVDLHDDHRSTEERVDVAFASGETYASLAGRTTDVYALSLAPLGLPFRPGPPAGTLDYSVEVRGYGDHFSGPPVSPDQAALADGTTHAALATAALDLGLSPCRYLIDADAHPDALTWLVAPLLAGASIVLCRHLDHARLPERLASERASVWG
jgi:uncharacterized protein (TIGR03089 family)